MSAYDYATGEGGGRSLMITIIYAQDEAEAKEEATQKFNKEFYQEPEFFSEAQFMSDFRNNIPQVVYNIGYHDCGSFCWYSRTYANFS